MLSSVELCWLTVVISPTYNLFLFLEETYDTPDPVEGTNSIDVGRYRKSQDSNVEDILYTIPSDLNTEAAEQIDEVVYDMLETKPKIESTLFSPPDANSLRPFINIVSRFTFCTY